ncbi:MAG: 50S ribosomal protein L16 [archaeon]
MALRKALSYSHHKKMAYTRKSTVRSKNYIKAVPGKKVTKYIMGDLKKFETGKYPFKIIISTLQEVFIRDSAIEASRQFIHRNLDEAFKGNYYLQVHAHPHHVFRENKMLTGAGADRMQTGMSMSFGVPVGIAAHLKTNMPIFTVAVPDKNNIAFVRKVLKSTRAKLPCRTKILANA